MATRQLVCHVAICDVCGADLDEGYHWEDPQLAVDYAAEEDDWTLTGDNKLVCGVSDTAHYLVRGHESPTLLTPGPDAMSVSFAA
ncbi:hypothetical protein [Streptomyces canus]|uniref:hypothetical protein n=1 Tax=Streptomyces canus TaxID=58343 RepID=UPI00382203D1